MTKKQMGLIFTLMALLVCVAVLSLKLNENGLKNPSDLAATILDQDDSDKEADAQKTDDKTTDDKNKEQETSATQDSMFALRSSREKDDASAVQNLETIINNSNSSKEQKDMATSELSQKNKVIDRQKRIESNIKALGYNDALCYIDSGKAKVFVKGSELLDDAKVAAIEEVVQDVSSDVSNITIKLEK